MLVGEADNTQVNISCQRWDRCAMEGNSRSWGGWECRGSACDRPRLQRWEYLWTEVRKVWEGDEGASPGLAVRKNVHGGWNSGCRVPEAGTFGMCLTSYTEASEGELERGWRGGDESWEGRLWRPLLVLWVRWEPWSVLSRTLVWPGLHLSRSTLANQKSGASITGHFFGNFILVEN